MEDTDWVTAVVATAAEVRAATAGVTAMVVAARAAAALAAVAKARVAAATAAAAAATAAAAAAATGMEYFCNRIYHSARDCYIGNLGVGHYRGSPARTSGHAHLWGTNHRNRKQRSLIRPQNCRSYSHTRS